MTCVSKHDVDIDSQCEPKCSPYEKAVHRVVDKSNVESLTDEEMKKLQKDFNDICTDRCSDVAAKLLFKIMESSLILSNKLILHGTNSVKRQLSSGQMSHDN
uniref:Uncharacterized protein n=1 Tax=Romanomermis culicivorax TaxID=13658 RepID=A0A915IVR0_ROMCU